MKSESNGTDAANKRERILKLNVVQTWLIVIGTAIGIAGAVAAWAQGWLGLPERVKAVEESMKPISNMVYRLDAVEHGQTLMWQKRTEDHDLLLSISQKLTDMAEQQKELREDVKTLKR